MRLLRAELADEAAADGRVAIGGCGKDFIESTKKLSGDEKVKSYEELKK
jgi:hypothetical protein